MGKSCIGYTRVAMEKSAGVHELTVGELHISAKVEEGMNNMRSYAPGYLHGKRYAFYIFLRLVYW
jgi:hypothetical protein